MAKVSKLILVTACGLVVALILAGAVFVLTRGVDVKGQVQALASAALGMQVQVDGQLHLRLFPSLHVTMEKVRIRNGASEIASASQASVGVELLPLLHREVRMGSVALKHVRISIERRRDGTFNFETRPQVPSQDTLPRTDVVKVSLSDVTLLYTDRQTGRGIQTSTCDLNVRHLQLRPGNSSRSLGNLSFKAALACDEIKADDLVWSEVKSSISAKAGVFDFAPLTMHAFGGKGSGAVRADFSAPIPQYRVEYSLSEFRLSALCKFLSPACMGDGPMEFTTQLTLQGKTIDELMRSAVGEASLRADDLTLEIGDIDKRLARFESSQSFNLVDVGAFFLAGPAGLAVTKGYNFASIFLSTRGSSHIRTFVSEWSIADGIAQAKDVALATKQHRIAMQGGLDFVNGRFEEVTVALIDAQGCSRVRQQIRGTFDKPEVQRPSVLKSFAGPARNLFGQATRLVGRRCSVFYAGSVEPPR